MKKVYLSFIEATFEQMLINGKVSFFVEDDLQITTEEYNRLFSFLKNDACEQCNKMIAAVVEFNEQRDKEKVRDRNGQFDDIV